MSAKRVFTETSLNTEFYAFTKVSNIGANGRYLYVGNIVGNDLPHFPTGTKCYAGPDEDPTVHGWIIAFLGDDRPTPDGDLSGLNFIATPGGSTSDADFIQLVNKHLGTQYSNTRNAWDALQAAGGCWTNFPQPQAPLFFAQGADQDNAYGELTSTGQIFVTDPNGGTIKFTVFCAYANGASATGELSITENGNPIVGSPFAITVDILGGTNSDSIDILLPYTTSPEGYWYELTTTNSVNGIGHSTVTEAAW